MIQPAATINGCAKITGDAADCRINQFPTGQGLGLHAWAGPMASRISLLV